MKDGWIGVDLDGTLAEYDVYRGVEHIGPPIPAMVARVKGWLADKYDVRVFTARVDGGQAALAAGDVAGEEFRDVERVVAIIQAWCLEHIGVKLPVTNRKDYAMIELYDDRAVQVEMNTGRIIGRSTRGLLDEKKPRTQECGSCGHPRLRTETARQLDLCACPCHTGADVAAVEAYWCDRSSR